MPWICTTWEWDWTAISAVATFAAAFVALLVGVLPTLYSIAATRTKARALAISFGMELSMAEKYVDTCRERLEQLAKGPLRKVPAHALSLKIPQTTLMLHFVPALEILRPHGPPMNAVGWLLEINAALDALSSIPATEDNEDAIAEYVIDLLLRLKSPLYIGSSVTYSQPAWWERFFPT